MSEVSKLVEPSNPALRVRLEGVSEKCDREKVRQDLIDSMQHYNGIGLSANQIGIMERVFIMYENINTRNILTCFNPKILELSGTIFYIGQLLEFMVRRFILLHLGTCKGPTDPTGGP